MTITIFLLEALQVAQVLVPTSLLRIQDLKTHTEKTQAYFAFLSLISSPNLRSRSPAFPSATIYIRIGFFFPPLNNDGECRGSAKVQRAEAQGCKANHKSSISDPGTGLGTHRCSQIRSPSAGTRVAAASAASAGHSSNGQR